MDADPKQDDPHLFNFGVKLKAIPKRQSDAAQTAETELKTQDPPQKEEKDAPQNDSAKDNLKSLNTDDEEQLKKEAKPVPKKLAIPSIFQQAIQDNQM